MAIRDENSRGELACWRAASRPVSSAFWSAGRARRGSEDFRREFGVAADGRLVGRGNKNYQDDSSGRGRQRQGRHGNHRMVDITRTGHYAAEKSIRSPFSGQGRAGDETGAIGT